MRFALESRLNEIEQEFNITGKISEIRPNYNAAPMQNIAVIVNDGNGKKVTEFKWGLVPPWAKDRSIGSKLLNARGETVDEKPSFREAFKKKRCIIPVDGYYEWITEGEEKFPVYIQLKSGRMAGLAGLWECWRPQDDLFADMEETRTCTIITTESNEMIRPFHHRMPVIIPSNLYDFWLDPGTSDMQQLKSLITSFPAGMMKYHRVSTLVNSTGNNNPECIKPL